MGTVLKVSFRTHTHNFNMNAYIISALALVAVVGAEPLFFAAPAAFVASAIPAGSNAAAIARSKRAADDNEAAFIVLANAEPAQCYHRLICDLATGVMPKSENDVILSLFNKDVSIESPKFGFNAAAKLGKKVKSTQVVRGQIQLPLSSSAIQKLFN